MYLFARQIAIESWILYVVGILIIGCRLISRRIRLGSWKKLEIDDGIMCLIAITFTGVIVSTNQIARVSSDPTIHSEPVTPYIRNLVEWGNKMTFAMEQFSLVTIWLVKCCLLIIYSRLTLLMKEHMIVKLVAVYVVLSFIVVEILFCGVWCRPISWYWDYDADDFQCSSYLNHLIITTVFNISSDIFMLCIPLPLFIRSHLPIKQKIAVCAVFSLGGIVILMASLNKYYNFTRLFDARFLKWYIAEVSTAVYISNLPLLWPLLRTVFHRLRTTGTTKSSFLGPPPSHRLRSTESTARLTIDRGSPVSYGHELGFTPARERGYMADVTGLRRVEVVRT
ncbi:hypothetical protein BDV25DRAFT_136199 [Aspergillus avenaceus]|uniref:Rhodopsin domain-containing protein n=1 Tax=Aspergillus avenaceus TaxID=36643 RepID=A0A5N6U651_ASPAV|nr:hypothetical protein BDV25DRAFT_136199 [Aspergillus avenaceus]